MITTIAPRTQSAPGRTPDGDGVLVTRVLHGDRECYSTLVRRHQDSLYRHARSLRLDHDTALDLVQDSFIRAYASLNQCREPDRFRAWVLRILRNRCLDYFKDVRRRMVSLDSEPAIEHVVGPDERGALRDALTQAFDGLSDSLRETFLLKHQDGLSYEEMATITGASVSALKMRVHRARDLLRERLEAIDAM